MKCPNRAPHDPHTHGSTTCPGRTAPAAPDRPTVLDRSTCPASMSPHLCGLPHWHRGNHQALALDGESLVVASWPRKVIRLHELIGGLR